MNENNNGFHWCWDRCQFMPVVACEARVRKGICKMLLKPELLEPWKVETWKNVLHTDITEQTMECKETNKNKKTVIQSETEQIE